MRSFRVLEPAAVLAVGAMLSTGVGCKPSASTEKPTIKVSAASDLSKAFPEIGEAFEKKTGQKVVFSFGATGVLATQIVEGAPVDVFAAANVSYVDDVLGKGKCKADTKSLFARGKVAIWSAESGPTIASIEELKDPKYKKIAIANPEHAPYGKAAKEALEKAGIYDAVKDRLVYGENVAQALQFATSGNADVAIVAYSVASASPGHVMVLPDGLHKPMNQAMVLCETEEHGGAAFMQFVASDEGRAIMKKYGFDEPTTP